MLSRQPVRERLARGRDADDPHHRLGRERHRSFIFTIPSRTSNSRVSGACTRSLNYPKPGISVATPHSTGRTSRISATNESPGSAPRTDTGPVALLIRSRSI
jgi:hypothetical protein